MRANVGTGHSRAVEPGDHHRRRHPAFLGGLLSHPGVIRTRLSGGCCGGDGLSDGIFGRAVEKSVPRNPHDRAVLGRDRRPRDGIAYHSQKTDLLPAHPEADVFTAAELRSDYPLVVVTHEECASQVRDAFEQALIGPVLLALADPAKYGLGAGEGLGIVVPHRAQRAAI